ncbi:MAG: hypothetical protein DYH03_17300 [Nitrospira sp. NTP1]|nr:hypothetical protein [Nitrospira sp. NTP1]
MNSARNLLLSLTVAAGCLGVGERAFAQGDLVIADGLKVSLEYTLSLPDKSVADSNVGQEPITFVQGAHEAGQKRRIDVSAQDAYGPYNNKLRQSIDKDKLPKDVKVGDILQASDNRLVKVLEVNEKKVLIDLNHPLAGKTLTFDVNILKVEKGDAADAPDKKTRGSPGRLVSLPVRYFPNRRDGQRHGGKVCFDSSFKRCRRASFWVGGMSFETCLGRSSPRLARSHLQNRRTSPLSREEDLIGAHAMMKRLCLHLSSMLHSNPAAIKARRLTS